MKAFLNVVFFISYRDYSYYYIFLVFIQMKGTCQKMLIWKSKFQFCRLGGHFKSHTNLVTSLKINEIFR